MLIHCIFSKGTIKGTRSEKKHVGEQFLSDKCEFKAVTRRILNAHINNKHKGVRVPCNECKCTANSSAFLLEHIRRIRSKHDGVRFTVTNVIIQNRFNRILKYTLRISMNT